MKQADHPFHIQFIENFVYQNQYFCLITKYAAAGDLTKLIYQKKKFLGFTEKEALIYLAQMLLAIESIHKKDVCHRDLKPDNIFVEEQKNEIHTLKIGDFGCARQDLLNGIKNNKLTAKVGSPAYWAPEIFDEELYSAKVDIWAIGVIFFEILTKTHPFVPDTKVSQKVIMKAIKENDL